MPDFFIDLRTPEGLERNDVPVPFVGLEAAYLDACEAIPALTAELVQEGRDPSGCVFEIRDAARRLVMEVPFSERRRPVRRPAPSGLSDETAALFARLDRVLLSIRHEQEKLRANMEAARASLDQARGVDGRFF